MASSGTRDSPFYIVGLPDSPAEASDASDAKMKFERLSLELTKVFPHIEEIRAVVKTKNVTKEHARYEVTVEVYTPTERHAFSETGYSLVSVFDSIGPKMKRLLASKQSKVTASGGSSRRKLME